MSKQKILIVDDDNNIAELISLYLTKECYDTKIVNDGEEALHAFEHYNPNLILLDLMLPGIDGYQVCREIRTKSNVPIIMLSAKGEIFDKVLGLELGADDYILKPFDSKELVARVKAVLRRFQPAKTESVVELKCVEYPDLTVNLSNYSVMYNGHLIDMPPKELELLYFLAASPNQVFTREQLLDHIWGYEYIGDTRTVDVHVKRLREKIKDHETWSIATVWGIGYKFEVKGFIILCTFTQHAITHYAENREAQQLYRESVQIASGYADNYNKYSFSLQDFQKQMQSLGEYLSAQIWIMDNQGNILFDSTDESVGKNAANANYKTLKGFNTSDFGNRYYMTGNFYGSFSEKNLTVFSPITSNYRIHSYVMIHKTVSSITQNANGFMNIVFYTIEFVFLTALFLLLLFAHGFYRPLHRLTIVSESYAKGNFEPRTQIHRNDELGYLANTMDYMANELDTLEEDQRKFISNVSHDFRSPLTSIKGYIEAMLDGTIPPELQNKYLNIILFETERLTKLTQGILDLNRFGQHRGMMLDLTDFDINRMIKTTILTFEGTCSAKGLSFDLVLTGQKLYVHGDMSKIQQVLYNLIDNATKFSHNDASIKIETSIKNEKVLISVKDSGIGIPAESIKKIWDRFYKTDLSRGKDKRGTGLGLAIVKEIIQAHNEHINVISTEGVGTEFIFTLPLAKKEVQS